MRRVVFAAVSLALAGCLGPTDSQSTITLDFDFNTVGEGWTGFASDIPQSQLVSVALAADLRTLPAPFPQTEKGLYLRGTNTGGDLFLYQTKYIPGLAPNATFTAELQIDFITNFGAGCTTGAGPLTVIKAGLTDVETSAVLDGANVIRIPVNKGVGTSGGEYTQLGDIRNSTPGCPSPTPYSNRQTGQLVQPATFTTDIQGGFFIFLGTQSSFVGTHEIWFTDLRLILR